MKRLLFILFFLPCVIFAQSTYYVATDGDDDDPGTFAQPWATWDKAFASVSAGDTVYFRGGTYRNNDRINFSTTGTQSNPIVFEGYPADIAAGNWPILNCEWHCDSGGADQYNAALQMTNVQYIELRCLEMCNVYQCDGVLSAIIGANYVANITYDRLRLHHSGSRGFSHVSGAWNYADSAAAVDIFGNTPSEATPVFAQPDTTRWLNCDVWECIDTLRNDGEDQPGNGGDAWKVISYNGNYYYWEGCRAWNYSDDGYDPNNGKRVFKDCWAMSSDKYEGFPATEGNGFKFSTLRYYLFDYYTPSDSLLYMTDSLVQMNNCLSLYCLGAGIIYGLESDSSCNGRIYNHTSYACGIGMGHNFDFYDTLGDLWRNNISYASTTLNASENPFNWQGGYCPANVDYCTWIPQGCCYIDNPSYTVSDADFVTTDSATLVSLFTAARQADGSLPVNRPLMLAEGSDLIDGGTDVGLPYNGTAPDLGYSEYGDDTIPLAAFSADNTTVCKEDSVQFSDASTNTPLTWAWSFPGGSPDTSNLQNPKIEYQTAGTYTVSLHVTNADSSDTETKTNYITVRDSVVADFSASETSVNTGANISFTDLTTNNPSSWSWTFAGGTPSVSTSQNPTIQYNTAGTYTVTLESTNTCNSDTETKTGHITVSNPYAPASSYRLTIKFR